MATASQYGRVALTGDNLAGAAVKCTGPEAAFELAAVSEGRPHPAVAGLWYSEVWMSPVTGGSARSLG